MELANSHQLEHLQWKVEYLSKEVNMLEFEKTIATNHILKLSKIIDQLQGNLPQKMTYMNQESGWYDNTGNLYPIYLAPDNSSYSIRLSYSDYWP
ncbi:MAG: hypothetical protein WA667_28235 [Candidatus Nitrosopolaris sp.]